MSATIILEKGKTSLSSENALLGCSGSAMDRGEKIFDSKKYQSSDRVRTNQEKLYTLGEQLLAYRMH